MKERGVGYVQRHDQMNLYHVVGVTHGYIGDAPTQLRVEEHPITVRVIMYL